MLRVLLYKSHRCITQGGAVEERGGLAMRTASIHLRSVEVSDEHGVFYLHNALGAGQSRRGSRVETTSGDDLQGAGGDNIRSR